MDLETLELFGDYLGLRFYREVEVLELIFKDLSNDTISDNFCISRFT